MIGYDEFEDPSAISHLWNGRLISQREFRLLLDVMRSGGMLEYPVWDDPLRYSRMLDTNTTHILVQRGELVWYLDRTVIGFPWFAKLPLGQLLQKLARLDRRGCHVA